MLPLYIAILSALIAGSGLCAYILVLLSFKALPTLWAHSFFKLITQLAVGDLIILCTSFIHWIPSLLFVPKAEIYNDLLNGVFSTTAHLATWYIFLTTTAIAINRLIGTIVHPLKANAVAKDKRLMYLLVGFIWAPLLVSTGYFGRFGCYIRYKREPFDFLRICPVDPAKVTESLYFGFTLCFVCLFISIVCYLVIAIIFFYRKLKLTSLIQMRNYWREARLCYQGGLIVIALIFEYFCSYMVRFHKFQTAHYLFLLSIVINSSINPWILLIFNREIKREVWRMISDAFQRTRRPRECELQPYVGNFSHTLTRSDIDSTAI